MARDLNKVQLTGRLGADPALRYTAHGSAIATFRVASNRIWRTASGANHEDTEWFRVVAWDQLAEQCHRLLARGAHIYVEGRLQTREWADEAGQPRTATEVIASEVIVLDPAGDRRPPSPGEARSEPRELRQPGEPRAPRRASRVRPAAPPPGLTDAPPTPPMRLTEEDLPI
jgi:single-strand DNA-binding protein